jgi:16S rRNA processing protein RimM
MRVDDCFELGTIARTHGNNGALVFALDVDKPQHYNQLESILLEIDGELVPFFLRSYKPLKQDLYLAEIEDIGYQEAQRLVGESIYLPLTMLPALKGKAFYFHEVIGFTVIDKNVGELGELTDILERPPQPVFVISSNNKEIYLPAIDEFIEHIDRTKGILKVICPEGLIGIYGNT